MKTPKKDAHKKHNFINYWKPKRKNRLKFALLQSLFFAIPFSIVFQFLESTDGFLSLRFVIKFVSIFCVYFLLSFYVAYTIYEKKYQKLLNS